MRCFGRLKIKLIGGLLLSIVTLLIISLRKDMEKYITDFNMERTRKQCGISICTPCQFLDPDEKEDVFKRTADVALQITHYSEFPPPKTNQMENLPVSGIDRIDTIIHQSWYTKMVPMQFKEYMKTLVENHFSWKYMFWTDKSTRQFIENLYPNLLPMYDNYVHPLNRPDAMRYIILFHFGGVYCDLDIQSLHPLDPIFKKYSCILGQEPHVHSIVYTSFYEQASNAFMACRKRHPFMKNVIENLVHFSYFADILDSTGPRFLTFCLRQYIQKNRDMQSSDDDYVYLAPPEYFLPTVDQEINKKLEMLCAGFSCLSSLRQWQCDQWKQEGIRTEPYQFSFTNHLWVHITYKDLSFSHDQNINIFEICPDAFIYE